MKRKQRWIVGLLMMAALGFVAILVVYARRPYLPPDFRFLQLSIEPPVLTRYPPPNDDSASINGVYRVPHTEMARKIDAEMTSRGWTSQGPGDWQNSDSEEVILLNGVLDFDSEGNPRTVDQGKLCSTVIWLKPKENWAQKALRFLHLVN